MYMFFNYFSLFSGKFASPGFFCWQIWFFCLYSWSNDEFIEIDETLADLLDNFIGSVIPFFNTVPYLPQ